MHYFRSAEFSTASVGAKRGTECESELAGQSRRQKTGDSERKNFYD